MRPLFSFCFLLTIHAFAQHSELAVTAIPAALTEHANAVVRSDQYDIEITSQRSMSTRRKMVMTILNSEGLDNLDLTEYYDKGTRITSLDLRILDAAGREIRSFRKKDFKDVSVGDGFSVFNDNRALMLEYTPVTYPFTAIYETEIQSSNTAFIPRWVPQGNYFCSVEKSEIHIQAPEALGLSMKLMEGTTGCVIDKTVSPTEIVLKGQQLRAIKGEEDAVGFENIAPTALFRLEKFSLEGVDGQGHDWKQFGKWYFDTLLTGTDEIPEETKTKIRALVGTEKDPLKIAQIVYTYVQSKTRYVSIQIGIGGWKPMLAKDVDRLGYGDCKALTNYTRSLLQVVGVPSYYAVVYAGSRHRRNIQSDFASIQGNHAILAIPDHNSYTWLECTSQFSPFGFQGTFTDNRDVLLITPDGGQIVKTKPLLGKDNTQVSNIACSLSPDGRLVATVDIVSTGSQYAQVSDLERQTAKEREAHYKNYFDAINNLELGNVTFENDKEKVKFHQAIALQASRYAVDNGNRIMFVLNPFNQMGVPRRYRTRENPFEVTRGFLDTDEITFTLPDGYEVEALPQNADVVTKFGEYHTSVQQKGNTIVLKRQCLLNDGTYGAGEYESYRQFREQISRNDNAKVVLKKTI